MARPGRDRDRRSRDERCAWQEHLHGRRQALNAGADLLLVAFAGEQFYSIFDCASDAAAMLRHDVRLEHNFRRRAGVRPQAK